MYASDPDSLRVAWKPRWGSRRLSLRLLFIHTPSSGSDNGGVAGEKRPEPPPWAPVKAQTAALLRLAGEVLLMSPTPPPVCCLATPTSHSLHLGSPGHAERSTLPLLSEETGDGECSSPPKSRSEPSLVGGEKRTWRTARTQPWDEGLSVAHGEGLSATAAQGCPGENGLVSYPECSGSAWDDAAADPDSCCSLHPLGSLPSPVPCN